MKKAGDCVLNSEMNSTTTRHETWEAVKSLQPKDQI
jgi:hypothetical protein